VGSEKYTKKAKFFRVLLFSNPSHLVRSSHGGGLHQVTPYTAQLRGVYSPPFETDTREFSSIDYYIDILGFLYVL
jgi:hypothetical protein